MKRGFGWPDGERAHRRDVLRQRGTVEDADKGEITWEYHVNPYVCRRDLPALLIANGWGEGCATLRLAAAELAQAGRQVYTFNHRRDDDACADPEAYKSSTLETVYREAMTQQPANGVSIIAHSEGGIGAVQMIQRLTWQEDVPRPASLVLLASAGLTPVRPERLLAAGAREVVHHALDRRTRRAFGYHGLIASADYVLPHIRLSLRELGDISATDLKDDVRALALDGMPISIVGCTRDRLFVRRDMRSTAAELADAGVGYAEVDATHVAFMAKPVVVETVLGQLELMEQIDALGRLDETILQQSSL